MRRKSRDGKRTSIMIILKEIRWPKFTDAIRQAVIAMTATASLAGICFLVSTAITWVMYLV